MREEVLLIIFMVWMFSLPNCTISGSIVTMSDRMVAVKIKNNYRNTSNITQYRATHQTTLSIHLISSWSYDFKPSCLLGFVKNNSIGVSYILFWKMSKHMNNHIRDSKPQLSNLKDFTYSVDIKKFSREKGNMTPLHSTSIYKKLQQRSNEKIRNSQPSSIVSFSKNISHKNMQTKRKLSSGCTSLTI